MTIVEFLEARIAEDEAAALQYRRGDGPHAIHLSDIYFNPQCQDCRGTRGQSRAFAECDAKRAMLDLYRNGAIGELYDGEKWTNPLSYIAAIYKDHPDYRQEWAL